LLVHRSIYAQTVNRLKRLADDLSIGPGLENHFLTPLISASQFDRVQALIDSGLKEGAVAVTGGARASAHQGHFMLPTVLADAAPHMRVMQEEIFGPVLTVCAFDTIEDAIRIANGTRYGLCAGIYTKSLDSAHRIAARLVAGQVFVNEWFAGGIETPFGGVRHSGFGREKGQEAIGNYVRTKNVACALSGSSSIMGME
jgi:acyl-CoA reductase-like NAD-dependent aldehyde dehydrogenase